MLGILPLPTKPDVVRVLAIVCSLLDARRALRAGQAESDAGLCHAQHLPRVRPAVPAHDGSGGHEALKTSARTRKAKTRATIQTRPSGAQLGRSVRRT